MYSKYGGVSPLPGWKTNDGDSTGPADAPPILFVRGSLRSDELSSAFGTVMHVWPRKQAQKIAGLIQSRVRSQWYGSRHRRRRIRALDAGGRVLIFFGCPGWRIFIPEENVRLAGQEIAKIWRSQVNNYAPESWVARRMF